MGEIDQIEEIVRIIGSGLDMKINLLDTVNTAVVKKRDESGNKVRNKTRGVVKKNLIRLVQKSRSFYINNNTRRIETRSLKSKPRRGKTVRNLSEMEIETLLDSDGDAPLDLDAQLTDCREDTTKKNT